MFGHHKDNKDKDGKDHKQRSSSFFGLSLKKKKSNTSTTGSSSSHAHESTTTNHQHHPIQGRANSRASGSSTEVSDVEHHHHQQQAAAAAAASGHHHEEATRELNQSKEIKSSKKEEHGHSMLELKRFFKTTNFKMPSTTNLVKPSSSTVNLNNDTDPFNNDDALGKKYGNMGKILGSGAGGSVRLLTRPSDGVTFAVKEFRARRPNEEMKEYVKKCTSEFSIGSTLHHPNIIKTLDIAHFGDHYYEVMEYAPIDFFALVMSGKMNRGEINCCFRQMVEGVKYLHSMGLAHRDLKLDNCVVTNHGILKLIDFGSAVVFKFPYEDNIVKARGIVGSDPYMAPEVYFPAKYDPQPVDLWSLAIIYCCMTIKRFPWKAPKQTDKSFKLYCLPDDRPHDYAQAAKIHKDLQLKRREERLRKENPDYKPPSSTDNNSTENVEKVTEVLDNVKIEDENQSEKGTIAEKDNDNASAATSPVKEDKSEAKPIEKHENSVSEESVKPAQSKIGQSDANLSETIKRIEQRPREDNHTVHGPYRLMRLLPHAARPIISQMLNIDPTKRATIEDIFNDEWFSEINSCTEDANGNPINSPGHTHTFIKEENAHLESYKEKDGKKK